MQTRKDMLSNARFWYQGYVSHMIKASALDMMGEADRAASHRSHAYEMLDFHFEIVDRIAEFSTVNG